MERRERASLSVLEAMNEIQVIENQVYTTGAVDVERSMFETIKESLRNGRMSPNDALSQAKGIQQSRQDYH